MCDGFIESDEQVGPLHQPDQKENLTYITMEWCGFWSYEDLPEKIAELRRFEKKSASRHIKFNTMKLFLDGTNEGGNSAMLTPHLNDPSGGNYGEIKMSTEELVNVSSCATKKESTYIFTWLETARSESAVMLWKRRAKRLRKGRTLEDRDYVCALRAH